MTRERIRELATRVRRDEPLGLRPGEEQALLDLRLRNLNGQVCRPLSPARFSFPTGHTSSAPMGLRALIGDISHRRERDHEMTIPETSKDVPLTPPNPGSHPPERRSDRYVPPPPKSNPVPSNHPGKPGQSG